MRKLILDMEQLAVESFEVSPAGQARTGTVAGHAAVDGGSDAVVVGPVGTVSYPEPWTVQEECFVTKDPRYYPCVCTYPVRETYDGGRYCAVEVYEGEAAARI